MKRKKLSETTKRKISESMKRYYTTPKGMKDLEKIKSPNHPMRTPEAIAKSAMSRRGKTHTEEHKKKVADALRGRKHSPERREKTRITTKAAMNRPDIRKKHLEACRNPERRRKISETSKGRKIGPHSEETKRKLSKSHKRENLSEETLKKMSEARTGRKHSEETKRKIGDAFRGKPLTEEHKRRVSAGHQGIPYEEWSEFIAYKEYCPEFNLELKEYIRNLYGRTCVICGKSTLQHISENGTWLGRLSVDHVDENKMQGCNDWEWRLALLCSSCHGKMVNIHNHLLLRLLVLNNPKEELSITL